MKTLTIVAVATLFTGGAVARTEAAEGSGFADDLLSIQQEFDHASFGGLDASERKQAFEALVEHAAEVSSRYPDRVEAVAWNGIVLSTYAGEVSALGAMKVARAAREALHQAEAIEPTALDGGLYASLGALYSKVPGGFVGFGDDDLAAEYFVKALAVDEDNIDTNFFYGEFLLEREDFSSAARILHRALEAPPVADRPLFNSGRRTEIEALLNEAEQH